MKGKETTKGGALGLFLVARTLAPGDHLYISSLRDTAEMEFSVHSSTVNPSL